MATVTLKSIPDGLQRRLKSRARTHRRSVNSEIIHCPESVLGAKSTCSAYDCELVALARSFETRLVATDRKLVDAFPDTAALLSDVVTSRR